MSLSERDRAILEFERSWWIQSGSKEQAIKSPAGVFGDAVPPVAGVAGGLG
jgi:hypothetical protein